VLFDKENSRNPINRRISIIVMTKEADESALKTDAMPESAARRPRQLRRHAGTPSPDAPPPRADAPPAAPK
jgi:chemotaxis protein MotB